jgi:hypothetical protein
VCSSKQFGVRENGCVLHFQVVTVPVSSCMHRGKFNGQLIIINFAEMIFLSACLNGRSVTTLTKWLAYKTERMQRCTSKYSDHKI